MPLKALDKVAKRTSRGIRLFLERYGYWLTILTLTAITVASLMPRGSTGDPSAVGVPDSFAHVLAYALVIFFPAATPSVPLRWPTAAVLAWGLAIECLQRLVGRNASLADIAANIAGVLVGILVGLLLRKLLLSLSA